MHEITMLNIFMDISSLKRQALSNYEIMPLQLWLRKDNVKVNLKMWHHSNDSFFLPS